MSIHVNTPTKADTEPYLIVSTDSHASPLLKEQLRDYCPKAYLEQFDEFVASWEPTRHRGNWDDGAKGDTAPFTDLVKQRWSELTQTEGIFEPQARLRDMDTDGIAAEVIFHGASTADIIPWQGRGFWQESSSRELEAVGRQIYNRWLADFVSAAPDRFIGAAQVPIWDVDASVKEVEWAAEAGLKCINFPAPHRSAPDYNSPIYEPFWAACAAADLPLTTHGGSGDMPSYSGPEAWALYMSDLFFYSRRGLWYLTWAGVFERYPNLKYVFVEQRSEWVPSTLAHLDSIYYSEFHDWKRMIPRPPSEYFAQNCYVASSFMARFEADNRHEIGIDHFMWGSDYPHYEGTWGYTDKVLRQTFAGMPVDDVRKILGENAVRCFNLDRDHLRSIADRIGPSPADVDVPMTPEELPDILGCSFRTRGTWS